MPKAEKPNFIIIFTGDQGYQDLGCFGSPNIKTPNIYKMATEGMKFTSFYAQTVYGPSRAALITGCYPLRNTRNDDEEVASRYYFNLKRLMDLFRDTFRDNYLPVVIGKISDSGNDKDGTVWDYGELVQYAQEKYAKLDDNASIVRSTKDYDYSDSWHYDSKGYIDLGEKFAEAVFYLNNLKY
ncbi:sulfatase-like hydrolase/transferase [Formosa sp. PL04]|uniref:sulfatase-like hydrolase/transferase n=1 Tax=Formosa sp. PL04 TaxID=3081755 RepID=UPI002981FD51|nr:sulfatase-like hydrolase/transferase [Formosa sp. PL04]MDW5288900.1 sulfatase-like hydrolase/transferase [Formosa sp. PL04]